MQVIIIEWWIIKLLKTLCFCTSSLEINRWNVHCFTPVLVGNKIVDHSDIVGASPVQNKLLHICCKYFLTCFQNITLWLLFFNHKWPSSRNRFIHRNVGRVITWGIWRIYHWKPKVDKNETAILKWKPVSVKFVENGTYPLWSLWVNA